MARLFDGVNDAITTVAVNPASHQMTVAFWLWWDGYALDDDLALESSTNWNSNAGAVVIDVNGSDGRIGVGYRAASHSVSSQYDQASVTVGAWHHWCIPFDTDLSAAGGGCTLYIDGLPLTPTGGSGAAGSNNLGNHAFYLMSRAASSLFGAGRMAEFTVWNVKLNSAEILALAKGSNPRWVRAANQNIYLPLWGTSSPEVDYSGNGKSGTVSGAVATGHAPVASHVVSIGSTLVPAYVPPKVDEATIYIDLQPSSADISETVDSTIVYLDLQPSGVEGIEKLDAATVYLDLTVQGGECFDTWSSDMLGSGEAHVEWYGVTTVEWTGVAIPEWSYGDPTPEGVHC